MFENGRIGIREYGRTVLPSTSRTNDTAGRWKEPIVGEEKKSGYRFHSNEEVETTLRVKCECKHPIHTAGYLLNSYRLGEMHQCARGLC